MTAIAIPDPLPAAITLPREVLEFAIAEHLKQFGESSWSHASGGGSSTEAGQARSAK